MLVITIFQLWRIYIPAERSSGFVGKIAKVSGKHRLPEVNISSQPMNDYNLQKINSSILLCFSKKIMVLGSADAENPPRGRALQLQQQIRVSATAFLRSEMLGLPTLPTEAKYLEMQEQRRYSPLVYMYEI